MVEFAEPLVSKFIGGVIIMVVREQVLNSLEAVLVPAAKRSIVGLNMVREVTISDG